MLGYIQSYTILYNGLDQSILIWADDCTRRERESVAEGANNKSYESLRQKDSYRTHLWRMLHVSYQRGKPSLW